MSKFHVIISFVGYNIKNTRDEYVEANSFKDVLEHIVNKRGSKYGDYDDHRKYFKENFLQVRDNFGCLPGDEENIWIYKID